MRFGCRMYRTTFARQRRRRGGRSAYQADAARGVRRASRRQHRCTGGDLTQHAEVRHLRRLCGPPRRDQRRGPARPHRGPARTRTRSGSRPAAWSSSTAAAPNSASVSIAAERPLHPDAVAAVRGILSRRPLPSFGQCVRLRVRQTVLVRALPQLFRDHGINAGNRRGGSRHTQFFRVHFVRAPGFVSIWCNLPGYPRGYTGGACAHQAAQRHSGEGAAFTLGCGCRSCPAWQSLVINESSSPRPHAAALEPTSSKGAGKRCPSRIPYRDAVSSWPAGAAGFVVSDQRRIAWDERSRMSRHVGSGYGERPRNQVGRTEVE